MSLHYPRLTAPGTPDQIADDLIGEGTIQCIRRWTACPDQTLGQLSDHFGAQADRLPQVLAPLVRTLTLYGRRPLMRHAPECPCRGADEAALAHLVAAAATQQREDAMLIAISLVRPDLAPILVSQAQALGLTLYSLRAPAPRATHAAQTAWLN